jgi:hypothetical protein
VTIPLLKISRDKGNFSRGKFTGGGIFANDDVISLERSLLFPKVGAIELARNVPADPLPPEPERFFGRKEVLYLTPLPHPQHLAEEGLPDL